MSTLPSLSRVAVCHSRGVLMPPVLLQLGPAACAKTSPDEPEKAVVPIINAATDRTRTTGCDARIFVYLMLTSHRNEVPYQGAPSTNARNSHETSNQQRRMRYRTQMRGRAETKRE